LGLPDAAGTSLILGAGFVGGTLLMILARWGQGAVPDNPVFPNMHMAWQYMIWALVQEFMLQSFFFTRNEELFEVPQRFGLRQRSLLRSICLTWS